jgi:hypothetical protein
MMGDGRLGREVFSTLIKAIAIKAQADQVFEQ